MDEEREEYGKNAKDVRALLQQRRSTVQNFRNGLASCSLVNLSRSRHTESKAKRVKDAWSW